ncbi:MAG: sulfotransferase, partial [Steroidobacteraceae bacterium]
LKCDAAYARYAALTPEDHHLGEAAAALATRRFAVAESLLQRRLAQAPSDVEALRMLAQVATQREDFPETERLLGECLRLEPGFARARFDLAVASHMQQKPGPVISLVDRLLLQEPRSFPYRALRASALTMLGQTERSIALMRELLAEYPSRAEVWLNHGHALRTAGQFGEAIAAYRKAIELQPGHGEAYFSLANLKTFEFEPGEIAAMHAALAREDLGDDDRLHFEFALGKACEDAGNYSESFAHYARGNALRREGIFYDPDGTTSQVRRARALYTRQFFTARSGWGCQAPDPIFIVGLPRSGSTLLEQILASHSEVEGTRELPDVPAFAYELGARKLRAGEVGYPESVATLRREQLQAYGERYLEQTRPFRLRGAARFIDKMPNNFLSIGLIHLMLPNSRIIDARRHPLGCGFSNFKQHFQKGLLFTYSLEEIGRFYRDYVDLMAHFDEVLPGRIHRVHYEHLVADPDREVRRLLEYCGLPFEAECLRFHENRRVVQTASSEQVRRPIYSEGVDQWRNFEPWLGPLKAALGDLVATYPPVPAG